MPSKFVLHNQNHVCTIQILKVVINNRQWPEVSDFVPRFCTLRESKQRAKKCDTNHIPRATA